MKKTVIVNGLCRVNEKKYVGATKTQHAGLVMVLIGAIAAIVGTVFKAKSYDMYYDEDSERPVELDFDENKED